MWGEVELVGTRKRRGAGQGWSEGEKWLGLGGAGGRGRVRATGFSDGWVPARGFESSGAGGALCQAFRVGRGRTALLRIRHLWPWRAATCKSISTAEEERDLGTLCAWFVRRGSPQAWERKGWIPDFGFKKHYLGVEEGKVVR